MVWKSSFTLEDIGTALTYSVRSDPLRNPHSPE